VSAERLHVRQFVDARAGQPWWMRALNGIGRLAPAALQPNAEDWWAKACAAEPEIGAPAQRAREGLAALVDSLVHDARLHLVGRISARDDTIRLARTHLRIERALREAPEIAQTPLPATIFIIGLPRSGTTFLHRLLAMDPATRTIPYWESFDPVPPRAGADTRVARLDRLLAQLARISPAYQAIHPMTAESAEECVALFMNELRTLQFDIQYRVPSYVKWLLAEDTHIAYEGYRRQLQLIQHHRPHGTRFLLKDPTHLVHLTTVIELFPTAKLIFTHRDPAFIFSSICSLYAHTRAIFSHDVDPCALGREVMDGYWPTALDQAEQTRAALPPSRLTDTRHADLVRDPLGCVAKIYADLGITLSTDARQAMESFLAIEAAAPKTVHEHSPEGFGLTGSAIRERFADYTKRFDL
jgi:hypothetical protein